MERQTIRVAPQVLDLNEPDQDPQEALFPTSGETPLRLDNNESTVAPSPNVINILKKAVDSISLNNRADMKARKLRRQLSQYSGVAFDSIACLRAASASSAHECAPRMAADATIFDIFLPPWYQLGTA